MNNYITLNKVYGYSDKSTKYSREQLNDFATDNSISYIFNELGHRTIAVPTTDYILVTGCSWTEGIGIKAEDRYSDIISRRLNIPVYNMALAASGPDLIYQNLMLWLQNFSKPKHIIIQHTYLNRAYYGNNDIIPLGPSWVDRIDVDDNIKDNFKSLLVSEYCTHYFNILRNINTLIDIPITEISIENITGTIKFEQIDNARDNSHPGIESNKLIAEKILQTL